MHLPRYLQRAWILVYQKNLHGVSCWEIEDLSERSWKDRGWETAAWSYRTDVMERPLTQSLMRGHKRSCLKAAGPSPDYGVPSSSETTNQTILPEYFKGNSSHWD